MTTLLTDIRSADWQPKLNQIGEVVENIEDVNQCFRVILLTRKGTDPHRPAFGSDLWKYIDAPAKIAIPNIIREVVDAIRLWESRVEMRGVTATIDEHHVTLRIGWSYKNTEQTHSLEVIV